MKSREFGMTGMPHQPTFSSPVSCRHSAEKRNPESRHRGKPPLSFRLDSAFQRNDGL